jgi:RNA polymerase sigma-70 factor, ECF subfamily
MNDGEAIRRCTEGETDAFRHLVHRYQRRALAHARVLLGNTADAADAAQEAFLDAFRHLGRFEAGREFYPWFYVMLRNRCFKARRRGNPAATPLDEVREIPRSTTATPEAAVGLRAALDRLSAADRELIVLKHQDGWTYDEIASRLAIPRGTVMSRLFHARQRLHGLLGGTSS